MKLAGKVALITGAGGGIGSATARAMAAEGAKIVATGIPAQSVEEVVASLHADGYPALAIPMDVSDGKQVEDAFAQAVEHFGRLDIVVPNAAIQLHDRDVDLHELPEEVWDQVHNVNYRGVYLTVKYGLAHFLRQGDGGVVVIVVSVAGLTGRGSNPAYTAGKHGLLGINSYVAVNYASRGIRCNAVCPGALERTPNHDIHPDPEGRAARLRQTIPMGRPGRPEEIAPMIAFLATADAAYANGGVFVVDGGLTAV